MIRMTDEVSYCENCDTYFVTECRCEPLPAPICSPEFTGEIRDYLYRKANEYGEKAKDSIQPDFKNYRDMSWAFRFVQEVWSNEANKQNAQPLRIP